MSGPVNGSAQAASGAAVPDLPRLTSPSVELRDKEDQSAHTQLVEPPPLQVASVALTQSPPPLLFVGHPLLPASMAVASLRIPSPHSSPSWDGESEPEELQSYEILLNQEASKDEDVIVLDSSDPPLPALPEPSRDLIAYEVQVNRRDIEDLCICCGSTQVYTQHPLFEGGMCTLCKDRYLNGLFLYDDDGHQSLCSICGLGDVLLMCESPDCTRCYCFECVDALLGPGKAVQAQAQSKWACFLCLPLPGSGLLRRRTQWRARLKAFQDRESAWPQEIFETVPVEERRPMRVLCLFADIGPELASLGFLWSDAGPEQLKIVHDVTNIVRRDVKAWGAFDLVFGSTPPIGQYCNYPCESWYLFQFHRILQYTRPPPGSSPLFFWAFVDALHLKPENQAIASRFLETDPVTIQDSQDKDGRTIQNAVRMWSNIPAVKRHTELAPEQEAALLAKGRQWSWDPRALQLVKSCFLPLKEYFEFSCPSENI
ncbi:DNA (cytosine-5)-methyltransferase 3-like [Suncus etruscus]|uniref:DNA (cytosine-5)-methyltransferase 3-like n=1 Tax=Suncus etruscus TaxID=109475 RepID=UPI00210F7F5E|nr:DNA (cytosine-5)-methyltransferase 3-like [Suncus etruscus]